MEPDQRRITYSPNVVEALQNLYSKAVSEGDGCECDFRIHRPDGDLRWIAWEALAYIDPNGTWQRVNSSCCELLGYSAEELYGMTFQQITHPDDLAANLQLLVRLLTGDIDRYEVEKRERHKAGHYIWIRARTALQRRQDGQPEHLISVFENIAAERQEHERLETRIAGLEAQLAAN